MRALRSLGRIARSIRVQQQAVGLPHAVNAETVSHAEANVAAEALVQLVAVQ